MSAKRLLTRLASVYGHSIGTIVADPLYDDDPFCAAAGRAGYHTVIRRKDPDREPGKSARKAVGKRDL
ncbi:MAG: hypothetical protein FJZ00_12785 [Candidatus Sericytochromatia bacterium]|uniref:Uncharacterized protein n=1 Tax=Candidatus Tanganyikabacteria bacterium TaxID=2961651 RepID=A0A937X786_9BACT|nr:hypothetical protein [Candidatus Tanganyikabacteria bacterium]